MWIACALVCICGLLRVPWRLTRVWMVPLPMRRRVRLWSESCCAHQRGNRELINWACWKAYCGQETFSLISFKLWEKTTIIVLDCYVCGDSTEINVTSHSKLVGNSASHVSTSDQNKFQGNRFKFLLRSKEIKRKSIILTWRTLKNLFVQSTHGQHSDINYSLSEQNSQLKHLSTIRENCWSLQAI